MQWTQNEEGQFMCAECAKRPVIKEISKNSRRAIKRAIVSCYEKEVALIRAEFDNKRKKVSLKQ